MENMIRMLVFSNSLLKIIYIVFNNFDIIKK